MRKLSTVILFALCCIVATAQSGIDYEGIYHERQKIVDELYEFAKAGDFANAEARGLEALEFCKDEGGEARQFYEEYYVPQDYYNLACVFSLKGDAGKAVEMFAKCVDCGYDSYRHASTDSDLDLIRDSEDFKALMETVRGRGDYPYILQQAGQYRDENIEGYPRFGFQDREVYPLRMTNEFFQLDTIAPGADEITRIVRILDVVGKTVPHDGGHMVPVEPTAMTIYSYSAAHGNRGVNCRCLAIMLTECYLAQGFNAFHLTCFPKSETDPDCHVITAVWSKTLGKYLWMDPSWGAYPMDEEWNLLSFEEVRQRIIEGLPVRINDDAMRNGEPTDPGSYLNYMAKNLYWFARPVENMYNTESRRQGTGRDQVALIPEGYQRREYHSAKLTHDPGYFWERKVPEGEM